MIMVYNSCIDTIHMSAWLHIDLSVLWFDESIHRKTPIEVNFINYI